MHNRRSQYGFMLLFGGLVLTSNIGCGKKTNPSSGNGVPAAAVKTIRVGIATWGGFGNVYVANAKGFWNGLKVEAKVMDDAKAREAAFASGSIDVMISSVDLYAQEA